MKKYHRIFPIALMATSMVLLVILECLWLFRTYEKEFFDLRRDASLHLRTTVAEMRDSVLMTNVQPISRDSAIFRRFVADSIVSKVTRIENSVHAAPGGKTTSSVRVFITTDSLRSDVIKPLVDGIGTIRTERDRAFFIRVNEDSLDTKELEARYARVLADNRIHLPAKIHLVSGHPATPPFLAINGRRRFEDDTTKHRRLSIFGDTMNSSFANYNPVLQYSASFTNVRRYLLAKITPEILFSLFLTILTLGAFLLIYSNMRRQQRLVQAKDEFISNVTHELKTPVATVSVALEALKNFNALDKPQLTHEYLEIALKELARLSALTDNILRNSVLEGGSRDVVFHPIDLSEIVSSAVASIKVLADAKGAAIEINHRGNDFRITGAQEEISGAITNLLDNALKYSTANPRINIDVEDEGSRKRVVISDNGIGIASSFHKKIFEKFFRVPQGNVHTIKGHGLGLNYVHSVMKMHGGTVSVDSSPEKGSQFTLNFPVQ